MKLKFEEYPTNSNLLPYDGEVYYFDDVSFSSVLSDIFPELLHKIDWQPDVVKLFGKTITTKRKVALYANKPVSYSYSNQEKISKTWIPELIAIKNIVEELTQENFNCCLCNLYHDGEEGMGWHSDNEKILNPLASIVSVSFGTPRFFHFKHKKTKEKLKFLLEDGSLLHMKAPTQEHWLHALPKSKKITSGRINLTFRCLKNLK